MREAEKMTPSVDKPHPVYVRNLQRKLMRNREKILALHEEQRSILAELGPICDHSSCQVPWQWEHHDRGSGRKTMIQGRRCSFCDAKDYWNKGEFRKGDT